MYFCNFANLISYERLRELFGMKHSFYYVCLGFEDFKTLKYFISCSCLQLIIKNSFEQLKNDFLKTLRFKWKMCMSSKARTSSSFVYLNA